MFCPKCGEKLPDESKFCTACGANLAELTQEPAGEQEKPEGTAPEQTAVEQEKPEATTPEQTTVEQEKTEATTPEKPTGESAPKFVQPKKKRDLKKTIAISIAAVVLIAVVWACWAHCFPQATIMHTLLFLTENTH